LENYGIRAVIASSFADIFESNCYQNGLLPVTLPDEDVRGLMERSLTHPGTVLTVDLERCVVTDGQGLESRFEVDPFRRECLLQGLDDIDLTLKAIERIRAFEEAQEQPV
jgi:3-isopropylmalate/(R)-2-methylmalate dehydratase small subunit